MKIKQQTIARFLEFMVGFYFIAGAIPKAWDIDKFSVQMAAYKILEAPHFLLAASFFTVFLEFSLGAALLLALRCKGWLYALVQAMILAFSGMILYSWIFHGLKDCGCFPVIAMSPPVSLFKNLIIFASILFSWKTLSPVSLFSFAASKKSAVKFVLSCFAGIAGLVIAWQQGDFTALTRSNDSAAGIYAQFQIFSNDGYFDLSDGTYLVPVMSVTCPECKSKVPELNALWEANDLPPMIALVYEDSPGDLDEFLALVSPLFPTYSLGDRALLYFTLIDDDPFKFVIVRNGRELASWNGEVPEHAEIERFLEDNG
ncbi:MAG TPA: hypothetical protein PLQ42_03865 [Candidatus Hydrogenedentes bacterium]|jgi:hypothetical protein|nr:MAG: hypothetical protein BWY07_01965 [Candidatus Hydrogenedentes bacterium ADurb.Bin170]HOD94678.1 hypothetical protein [Candidatus Hydrogenedentota bacterium]HOR50197.1 hypothetical protein [Candidatus Hydrogenedentota bacterium]HPK24460.1 hypothetical protein [Candidatus Hydrogenedentota bacterium]